MCLFWGDTLDPGHTSPTHLPATQSARELRLKDETTRSPASRCSVLWEPDVGLHRKRGLERALPRAPQRPAPPGQASGLHSPDCSHDRFPVSPSGAGSGFLFMPRA